MSGTLYSRDAAQSVSLVLCAASLFKAARQRYIVIPFDKRLLSGLCLISQAE